MHIRNLVSPIALAVALSFSGGALSQTMIDGVEISAEDLPEVQAHCNTLAAESLESAVDTNEDDADGDQGDEDDNAGDGGMADGGDNGDDGDNGDGGDADQASDPAAEDDEASGLANALTSIDLDTLTIEKCREAGLVD